MRNSIGKNQLLSKWTDWSKVPFLSSAALLYCPPRIALRSRTERSFRHATDGKRRGVGRSNRSSIHGAPAFAATAAVGAALFSRQSVPAKWVGAGSPGEFRTDALGRLI